LIVYHSAGFSRASTSAPTWTGFGTVWAFAAAGWLALTRPLDRSRAVLGATISGGAAILMALVGLAVGLNSNYTDILHSYGWFGAATVAAVLTFGALLGEQSEA
jgi:hypothetical protein